MSKKPTVEVKKVDDVDSNVEMWPPSSQQPSWPALQTLQEGPKLRRSKCQTQIPFREGNIYGEQEHSTNILCNPLWQPRGGFPTPIWHTINMKMPVRNHGEYIRMHKDSLIICCSG